MGRVYNALVRAERWEDRERPIGASALREADSREADSYENAILEFENDHTLAEEVAKPLHPRSIISAGSALKAAASAPLPRRVAPSSPRPAFESPAASQPPTAAFEEPSEVTNVDKRKVDPHLASITGGDKLAAERYRALAVKVLNLAERQKLKTLLITSAVAAEGKTTVAINLAWSLAQKPLAQKPLAQKQQRRVLLIDATRTSDIGRMLGINPKRGWLSLADKSCEPKQAMVRLDPSGLYVMTSGAHFAAQVNEALSSRLEDVIADLAPQFDAIVVDSPSILDSPETQRLVAVLDGSVIIAQAGCTHHNKVTDARKLVPKARRLGVVLNESDAGGRRPEKGSFVGRLFGSKPRSA
jgi:Mrp family chromosome partitioning ATPase